MKGIRNEWVSDDGSVRLLLGDAREIVPQLSGYDSVLTDPPYGIAYSSGHGSSEWGDGAIAGDKDTAVRDAVLGMIGDVPCLAFGSWRAQRPAGTRMLLIWDTLGALGMGDLALPWKPSHQEIYVLGNRLGFTGTRDNDVITHPPVQSMAKNGRVHPFEKPVGLLERLLHKLRGNAILDPFMGSGSTAEAAYRLGRQCIGIEIDEGHFDNAVRRMKAASRPTLFSKAEQRSIFDGDAA